MKPATTLLRSRFGHRLLALFVLCALAPTIAVSVISLRNVTHELAGQAERRLHESSKSLGFAILERLEMLESNVKHLTSTSAIGSLRVESVAGSRDPIVSLQTTAFPSLDLYLRTHLAAGKSLLTTKYWRGQPPRMFLSRRVDLADESRGLIVAELKPDFLWGLPDRMGLQVGTELTIVDDSGQVLYSSTPSSSAVLVSELRRSEHSSTGEFEWSSPEETYLASYWSVFLKPSYGRGNLTVVLSESKAIVLSPIAAFQQTFLPVLLLSLLIVVAISIGQIRRSVEPLQALQEGAHRIAAQDFESRVKVTSGDEFEELAGDFNSMATRLGCQFAELGQVNEGLREQIQERELAERALRDSEQQLRHAQKMDAVGTLAGGVAHDFNNLLTVIVSYTEMVLATVDKAAPIREDLEQVAQAADRAAGLTRQLLAFSRKQMLLPQVLDLNELTAGIEKMLGRLIGENIEVQIIHGVPGAWVHADRGQMDQVLMNLAVNARDAMPGGGKLTIRTSTTLLQADEATRLGMLPGPCVVLSVDDTGTGIDESTRSRIFEPFFTTKGPGKGTGLGLSTVYGIVRQSGGGIALESELGVGTTFRIYLPEVRPATIAEVMGESQKWDRGAAETILLVEDEQPVRVLTQRILEESGYTVIAAGDGEEALNLVQQYQGPIHLLLTDVVMPQMGGKRLAAHLGPRRPEMRVLYMSGYSEETTLSEGRSGRAIELLQKPFLPRQLTQKIREVLDRSGVQGVV